MSGKDKDLPPISRDEVEVDGTYTNEWGREQYLKRGERFPFDPQGGSTAWHLTEYDFENHHEGRTDERLVRKEKGPDTQVNAESPMRHVEVD
ncbi:MULTISPECIES: transposase [Paenibacillus]|uniref:Transposase n=1 Tax=Paenibacillus campinasensis TaxID=66347 RepID=A0A268EQQ7_9BACL|nr:MULTISPECIES: transposase [Paenibacillus]MUG65451.1 transposase [Paenibacillus campinasensis]PAD75455.1 transposase [Paenibacillus campinasensis]PAK51441.1 transposase [Paenibacillus sp. 7541]